MNIDKFTDKYFKLLVLTFWPIMWYKLKLIPDIFYNKIIAFTYFTFIFIYIAILLINYLRHKNENIIIIYYRISMVVSFVFTIISFILYPTNELFLLLKMISVFLLLYVSSIKVYKYKLDEGVVGILSALLMLTLTIFY